MARTVDYPTSQLVDRLDKVSILGELTNRQLKGLAKWVQVTAFAPDERVVKRGDEGTGLFLILEGSAEVRRGSRVLAKLGPGQFFGEMTLFDDEPRSADVVATTPSKFGVLSKWEFWGFAASEPAVLLSILKEMSRRLRATNQALAE
ncbi:MAG: Crp/Fnr family transcriptional regulator [Thermoplasmata archaeon]